MSSNVGSLGSDYARQIVKGRKKGFFFPLKQLDLEKKTSMKFVGFNNGKNYQLCNPISTGDFSLS